jgi:Hemerythrin HHE cation binding domain
LGDVVGPVFHAIKAFTQSNRCPGLKETIMSANIHNHLADDLRRIHKVIGRGLAIAQSRGADFVNRGFPDLISRQGYLDYGQCLITILEGHHDAEDTVIFPSLRKIPGVPFERMAGEHERLLELLDAANGAIDAAAVPRFVSLLAEIEDLWETHIAVEEQHFTVAAIDRFVTRSEQDSLGRAIAEHAMRTVKPEHLALPFVFFNLDPAEREIAATKVPPVVFSQLVSGPWKEKWAPMKPFFLD